MSDTIPLFPLNLVLLPRMPLPLHIFEERYRIMIERSLENKTPFGVVSTRSTAIQSIGCTAEIEQVLKRHSDGRLDILSFGTRRFRILETFDHTPYLTARVRYFTDHIPGEGEPLDELTRRAVEELVEFAELNGAEIRQDVLERMNPEDLSFLVCGTEIFGARERQDFLEIVSTTERLIRSLPSLEKGVALRRTLLEVQGVLGRKIDARSLLN
jgi:Lon protease-like protein